ncbi:hypothetical protein EJO69_10640 [Flaviflexus salsibiostraticola]|uniref:Uncharacterized protein n=1 Tax=Flaviflexus salsibiostraticola TaxID=1282737 RepID=A0A3S8ZB37_9ACTO|nr:hypothetical protein [Flaviflexus salsibiostraticola]AZN30709.1 hypothetical protein EJO69_10640 [Flaviflexus salsibiostraticola]
MMFPFTTPSPSPTDIPTEPWEATPGVEGFLLGFFFLGIVLAFLMWAMNRQLRRIKHSAAAEQRRAAEAQRAKESTAPRPEKAAEEPPAEPGNPTDS